MTDEPTIELPQTAGRPTKLTPQLETDILKYIRMGTPIKWACLAVGITESTFHKWIKRGEKEGKGKYFAFIQSANTAKAQMILRNVTFLQKAMQEQKNPSLILEYLARVAPEDFGRKDQIGLKHEGEIDIKNKYVLTDPEAIHYSMLALQKMTEQDETEDLTCLSDELDEDEE